MKKICLLFLIAVLMLSITACKKEILHCDGENCSNTVEVKVKKGETPDEDWVVFCQKCADKILAD